MPCHYKTQSRVWWPLNWIQLREPKRGHRSCKRLGQQPFHLDFMTADPTFELEPISCRPTRLLLSMSSSNIKVLRIKRGFFNYISRTCMSSSISGMTSKNWIQLFIRTSFFLFFLFLRSIQQRTENVRLQSELDEIRRSLTTWTVERAGSPSATASHRYIIGSHARFTPHNVFIYRYSEYTHTLTITWNCLPTAWSVGLINITLHGYRHCTQSGITRADDFHSLIQ